MFIGEKVGYHALIAVQPSFGLLGQLQRLPLGARKKDHGVALARQAFIHVARRGSRGEADLRRFHGDGEARRIVGPALLIWPENRIVVFLHGPSAEWKSTGEAP